MTSVRRSAAVLLLSAACAAPRGPAAPVPTTPDPSAPGAPCAPYGDDATSERTALEARAWSELRRALRASGVNLHPSGALDRAARAIASGSAGGEPRALARERVQQALRAAGSFDPAPAAHLAIGPPDQALAALLARVGATDATHGGIGEVEEGGVHHVALLLSRRRAQLDPFPGAAEAGATPRLRGELVGLLHPRVYVTRPDGASVELPSDGGRSFSATLELASRGRYQVEVLGTGARGPEVAALLVVGVGGASCGPSAPERAAAEPEEPRVEELRTAEAVNRMRGAQGRGRVEPSPELAQVARKHSARMLAAGAVAHVLPGDGELADRLAAARIAFRHAYENVASGATAADAHAAIEASPAHRANLLAPSASTIGVGVARGALPTGEPIVYLTEILVEPPEEQGADRLAPDVRVREALWRERARRGLPPLTNDSALEALARSAATDMRAHDSGEVDGLAAAALKMGRELVAADAFIARGPDEALRSRNLTDARFRRVGVGVATGNSRRFGPARLFIAVVYSN